MVYLQINTTQNVNINFLAASVGERILAFIIDLIIKIAYIVVTYQIVFNFFNIERLVSHMDQWSQIAIYVSFYLPVVFYSFLFETFLDGQTPGKRLIKIKVVKIDGYQASVSDYLVRWFFRIIDLNLLGPLFGPVVALVTIVSSDKNQRLGDMTAGTSVITLKNKVNISHTILEDLEESYVPTYPDVIKLSDNDARIIKETYTRARASRDYATLAKLRKKIVEVVGIKGYNEDDIKFINIILKDYNYYTQNM